MPVTAAAATLDENISVSPTLLGKTGVPKNNRKPRKTPARQGNPGSSYVNGHAHETAEALLWERTLLAPELKNIFSKVSSLSGFKKEEQRVINIGCGAAPDSTPLLRDGIIVDGVDRSVSMLRIAEQNIRDDEEIPDSIKNRVRLVPSFDNLKDSSYAIGMMDFVHQGCNTPAELDALFALAARVVQKGGHLIVVGEHPDHLNKKHSLYKCTTIIENPLDDGHAYKSVIINPTTKAHHQFAGSATYWTTATLEKAALRSGLRLVEKRDIEDPHICTRGSDGYPGYQGLVFCKS